MRVIHATIAVVSAVLVLAACGSPTSGPGSTGPGSAAPGSSAPTMAPPLIAVPAADGPVTGVGTVIEKPGSPPELCLGPVAESWPPQCEGLPLSGWDWATYPPEQQTAAGAPVTRWGSYAVTGTFDGLTLTVTEAISSALYDTLAEPTPSPVPVPPLTKTQWAAVVQGLNAAPGLLTVDRPNDTGPVRVSVVHDDGLVQSWADASFGVGAVEVTSALR